MSFDAFISYSSKDKSTADAVCAAFEADGIHCWIAPRDVRAGTAYAEGIVDGIDSCRLMVLIFSSSANSSSQVQREIERAVSKGLTIIPFRIEAIAPTKAMEYYLGSIHWLDALAPPLDQHLGRLVDQVRATLQIGTPIKSRSTAGTDIFVPTAKPVNVPVGFEDKASNRGGEIVADDASHRKTGTLFWRFVLRRFLVSFVIVAIPSFLLSVLIVTLFIPIERVTYSAEFFTAFITNVVLSLIIAILLELAWPHA